MKPYTQHVVEDRRLMILRILAESGEYRANIYLIQRMLANVGHAVSGDMLRDDLAWLEEHGLVEVTTTAGLEIPSLISRGLDAAFGRTRIPGVARPMPEA